MYFTIAAIVNSHLSLEYIIYDFIDIAGQLSIIVLLTIAIWGNGKYFSSRYSLFAAAVSISICTNTFSITTLLLLIAFFTKDYVTVKPIDDVYFGKDENTEQVDDKTEVVSENNLEKKIARLREKLDRGEITEEEFKDELMKLL